MTSVLRRPPLHAVVLAAPLVFVAHVLEEAPGFVAWFNAHVAPDITAASFWTVNLIGLGITLAVVAVEWTTRSATSAAITVAWLSFLMPANAAIHVAGAVVDGAYVPGLVTGIALYLPFYVWLIARARAAGRPMGATMAAVAIVGALPMLAHGYLIIVRGSRLF